jgi:hypothetical protein
MVVTYVSGSFEEEISQIVKQRPKLMEQTFQLAEAAHDIEQERFLGMYVFYHRFVPKAAEINLSTTPWSSMNL